MHQCVYVFVAHVWSLQVQSNPNNYNAHVTYLAVLRSAGRRADLLHARNKMHALFPLLPQLWREWFADEAATLTESSAATLIPLFESAVSEYLCTLLMSASASLTRLCSG